MSIFTKKNKQQRISRPMAPRTGTSPVVRYYRPNNSGLETKTRNDSSAEKSKAGGRLTLQRTLRLLGRSLGAILIVVLLLMNTVLSGVRVRILNDQERQYRTVQEYKQGLDKILSKSVWNKNKLSINSTKLENELKVIFPEITDASLVVPLAGGKLVGHLQVSQPLARLQLSGNNQAVISENGVVVLEDSAERLQSRFSGLPSISVPNVKTAVSEQLLTADETELIRLLISEMDGSDTRLRPKVTSVEYDVKRREIKVRFEGVSYYVKLTPEREARPQIGSLVAALKEVADISTEIQEYVDVRVEGRIFIK